MDEMQFDNDYSNQPNNIKSKSLTRLRPYSNQFTKQGNNLINKSIEFGNDQGDGISSIGGMMHYDENEPYSAYGMSDKNAYRKKVRFPGENKSRQSVQHVKKVDKDSYFSKSMGSQGDNIAMLVSIGGADSLHSLMDEFGDKKNDQEPHVAEKFFEKQKKNRKANLIMQIENNEQLA